MSEATCKVAQIVEYIGVDGSRLTTALVLYGMRIDLGPTLDQCFVHIENDEWSYRRFDEFFGQNVPDTFSKKGEERVLGWSIPLWAEDQAADLANRACPTGHDCLRYFFTVAKLSGGTDPQDARLLVEYSDDPQKWVFG